MRKLNKKGLKQQGGATQEQMMQQQMMQQQQAQQQAQQQQPSLPEMIQTAMQEDGLTIEQVVEELKFNGVEDEMIFNALSQLGYKQQEIIPLLQPQQQKTMDMNEAFKMQQEIPKAQLGIQFPNNPNKGGDFRNSELKRFFDSIYNKDTNPQNFVEDFRKEEQPLSSINTVPGAFESIFKGLNQMGLGLNIGKKNKFINQEFQALQDDPSGYALENTYIGYDPSTGFNALMANPAFMTPEQREYFLKRGKKLKDLSMTYASLPDGKTTLTSPDLAMMSAEGRGMFDPLSYGTPAYGSFAAEHGSRQEPTKAPDKKKNEINKTSSNEKVTDNKKETTVNNTDSKNSVLPTQQIFNIPGVPNFNQPQDFTTPPNLIPQQQTEKAVGQSFVSALQPYMPSYKELTRKQSEKLANTPADKRDYGSNKYMKEKILSTEAWSSKLNEFREQLYPEVSLPVLQAIMTIESGGDKGASSGAAEGLMQITKQTWTQRNNERKAAGLKTYDYETYKNDPDVNMMYGILTLKSKAKQLGLKPGDEYFLPMVLTSYNAGASPIKDAIQMAKDADEETPEEAWYQEKYLKNAIAKYRSIWKYYFENKQGRKRNKFIDQKTGKPIVVKDEKGKVIGDKSKEAEDEAIRLKYEEISGYVPKAKKVLPYYKKYYGKQPEKKQLGGSYGDPTQLQYNQQIEPIDSPTGMYPGDLFFDYMTNIGQYNTPIDIALDPITQTSKTTPFGPENMDYNAFENSGGLADLTRFAMGPYESDIYEQDEEEELKEYPYSPAKLETSPIATIDVDENYLKTDTEEELLKKLGPQTPKQKKQFDLRRFAAFSEGLVNTAAGINTLFDLNKQQEASNLYGMTMADNMALLDRVPSRGYYAVNPGLLQPDFKASNFPTYNPAQTVQEGAELPVYQSQGGFEDSISQFPYVVSEADPLRLKQTDEDVDVILTPRTQRFVDRKQKQFQRYNQDLSDFLSFMDGAKLAYKPTIAPYDAMTERLQREGKMKVFDQPMVSFANDDVRDVGSFFDAMYSGITPSQVTVNLSPKDKKLIRQKLRSFRQAARRLKKREGGMTLDVNSDMIAKLIAAGANIEML